MCRLPWPGASVMVAWPDPGLIATPKDVKGEGEMTVLPLPQCLISRPNLPGVLEEKRLSWPPPDKSPSAYTLVEALPASRHGCLVESFRWPTTCPRACPTIIPTLQKKCWILGLSKNMGSHDYAIISKPLTKKKYVGISFMVIPVIYLSRVPFGTYSKHSNQFRRSAMTNFPSKSATIPCVSEQYPKKRTTFLCLAFIKHSTSLWNLFSCI